LVGGLHAWLARACVCVTRIDHERANGLTAGQMLLANDHRRCAKTVARENARNAGSFAQAKYSQVAAVRFTNTSLGNTNFNTCDWINLIVGWDVQINGHGVSDSHKRGG